MENIFVFGYQNEASGKTTISISIVRALAKSGFHTGVFKPVSAHNFWYQYDHTLRNRDAGALFCEDIYKLARAAESSENYQLMNPVDRLISQPDVEKYLPPSPIERIIAERITSFCNGIKDLYLLNNGARDNLLFDSEIVNGIVKGKEVKECTTFREWNEIEQKKLPDAIRTCYGEMCARNEIVVIESYNNEISVLLPEIKHAIMASPGKAYIYDGKDFTDSFEANAETKGRALGEDIYREAKPLYTVKLPPLKKEQLENYDFLASEIGKPILETLGVL